MKRTHYTLMVKLLIGTAIYAIPNYAQTHTSLLNDFNEGFLKDYAPHKASFEVFKTTKAQNTHTTQKIAGSLQTSSIGIKSNTYKPSFHMQNLHTEMENNKNKKKTSKLGFFNKTASSAFTKIGNFLRTPKNKSFMSSLQGSVKSTLSAGAQSYTGLSVMKSTWHTIGNISCDLADQLRGYKNDARTITTYWNSYYKNIGISRDAHWKELISTTATYILEREKKNAPLTGLSHLSNKKFLQVMRELELQGKKLPNGALMTEAYMVGVTNYLKAQPHLNSLENFIKLSGVFASSLTYRELEKKYAQLIN